MRTLLMVLMIAGLMSTVGVYAADLGTATINTVGGTGSETVSAPTSGGVVVKWTTDASGQITGADVTWTPGADANYSMKVKAGSTTGSATITSSGTVSRTDSVTLTATAPDTVTTSEVTIVQT